MQERRDVGGEGCSRGGTQERRDAGEERCRRGGMQEKRDAERRMKGDEERRMRRDAGITRENLAESWSRSQRYFKSPEREPAKIR